MRCSLLAFCLIIVAGGAWAAQPMSAPAPVPPAEPASVPAPPSAASRSPAPTPLSPPAASSPKTAPARPSVAAPSKAPTPADNEAAKHAKRTACLGQARVRKLVGAQKTAFMKDCIGPG
jgi:hypothetical protein